MRKQAVLADYFLGSIHAIAETGAIVIASVTGSQLSPYAFSSSRIVRVAGAQKIVLTIDEAFRRVQENMLPHEDARMKKGRLGRTVAASSARC